MVDVFSMPGFQRDAVDDSLQRTLRQPEVMGVVSAPLDDELEPSLPRRISSGAGEVFLAEVLMDDIRLAERPRYLVEGGVGTGKSTLLEHLRYLLAERALKMPSAPIPVRLEARDIAEGVSTALGKSVPSLDPRVLEANHAFVYFVDGLDEVEQRRALAVQEHLRTLSARPSTFAMVLAGRPRTSYVQVPPGFQSLQVMPWKWAQVREFLAKWREQDPEAVAFLERSQRLEALFPVLSQPLTATFVLLLAHEEPKLLESRAELFQGIVEKLFRDWVVSRVNSPGEVALHWNQMAPAFKRLALSSLRSEKEYLSRGELRRLISCNATELGIELGDAAHRRFGLLVLQPDFTYRFLFKGLAEYLAGAALLDEGEDALRATAMARWGQEPVRHAIGLGVRRHGVAWGIEFIRSLVPGPSFKVYEFRKALVAVQSALDLGDAGASLAEPIATVLASALTQESSVWAGSVVANLGRQLAREGGTIWDALLSKLRPRILTKGAPASWFKAQRAWPRERWLDSLSHRDPEVRCVVIEKLAAWVNEPAVRDVLFEQVHDPTRLPFLVAPAYCAGRVLRSACRDEDFSGRLESLVSCARVGGQLLGGAAAFALRPGEAPAEVLVARLKDVANGGLILWDVVDELAALPDGRTSLDEHWPEWSIQPRGDTAFLPNSAPPVQGELSELPPLSRAALDQISRVVVPGLIIEERRRSAQVQLNDQLVEFPSRMVCEAALDYPEVAIAWVKSRGPLLVTQESELLLAEAAAQHPNLRATLLTQWSQLREQGKGSSSFPGGAFSHLVEQGDDEAATAYAEWLDVTTWLKMSFSFVFFWPAALRHPKVRPVAIRKSLEAWTAFHDGTETEASRRVHLSGNVMASILRALRPAWEGQTDLQSRLIEMGRNGSARDVTHALAVYSAAPYPQELAESLVDRFDALHSEVGKTDPWLVGACLDWVVRVGIADRMIASLEAVFVSNGWPRYLAAKALLGAVPKKAREVSARAAALWPLHWEPYFLPRSALSLLVRANPEAWSQQLKVVLSRETLPARPVFELARELVVHLDAAQRSVCLQVLYERLVHKAPPRWLRDSWRSDDNISFSDLFGRILFESGPIPRTP
ncbi:hypothetical protein HUA74_44210 [Myxococcus sp. CA051A]|uniref:NACHT domain-containing protein n=1 Tax=Myxococcus sp. CA051A TaxID=2741739 RepID=UPI00157AB840|nr:hypothetical protein [Myxococcus sp. CA051A]NTX67674.1 hypothetical protein [Myxococcus sp. CA051A]